MREFRVHHPEFGAAGIAVAGVSREAASANAEWARRLGLPYPLLSDREGEAGHSFGVTRRVGIGGWNIEFFRRCTFLADATGTVAAVWGTVKVRGHAAQVLAAARGVAGARRQGDAGSAAAGPA
jgi:peroxiredoxin Q/BCP